MVDFEKYLHERIKVEGKAGALGNSVKVQRDGGGSGFFPSILLNKFHREQNYYFGQYSLLKTLS